MPPIRNVLAKIDAPLKSVKSTKSTIVESQKKTESNGCTPKTTVKTKTPLKTTIKSEAIKSEKTTQPLKTTPKAVKPVKTNKAVRATSLPINRKSKVIAKKEPDERDPLYRFYSSLLKQRPDSEMALKWLTTKGYL